MLDITSETSRKRLPELLTDKELIAFYGAVKSGDFAGFGFGGCGGRIRIGNAGISCQIMLLGLIARSTPICPD